MRYLLLLSLVACIPPHFDEHPIPANDAVWIPAGAAIDGVQQSMHVKWFIRFPVDVSAAVVARVPSWGGHHVIDSGMDMLYGATLSTIFGCIWRGLHHDQHCIR